MLGLFGTLQLGQRSLQTQRQGVEVTGHNLANVNNPAYARQRVQVETSSPLLGATGQYGTGSTVTSIQQVRSQLVDQQVQGELSVSSYLESQQQALLIAQADLGQQIDRQSTGTDGTSTTNGIGNQHGIAESITDLFNSFQSLSTQPSSLTERQGVLVKAENLANKFNQVNHRLETLNTGLNTAVESETRSANQLLSEIAHLNGQIGRTETESSNPANDLRDARQAKLEELSKLVRIDPVDGGAQSVSISISGVPLVAGNAVVDRFQTYDAGGGQLKLQTEVRGEPLDLTGGRIAGTIEARDGAVASLRSNINELASTLISEVNQIHRAGFGVNGTTGADLFLGAGAGTIQLNSALRNNPNLLQASGAAGAAGDNRVVLQLAQLADKKLPALQDQTISQRYSQTVAKLGEALDTVNVKMDDQRLIDDMLTREREAVSGVSIDEEMTNLMKFQKGYEASAKLITTIDEMLDTVLALKR